MKRFATFILFYLVISSTTMAWIDGIWQPNYAVKSAFKLLLFGLVPVLFLIFRSPTSIKRLFTINWCEVWRSIWIGMILYFILVVGFLGLREIIDFSNITASLQQSVGVNAANFIYVALYISFINSLLEEFFFRGIGYQALQPFGRKYAIFLCSIIFSLYHVAMMIGWYEWWVFLASLLGLFIAGIVFHFLNGKSGTILNAWIVHIFCNLGINTVGLMLFGIL